MCYSIRFLLYIAKAQPMAIEVPDAQEVTTRAFLVAFRQQLKFNLIGLKYISAQISLGAKLIN